MENSNNFRADHRVIAARGGYCVKIPYKNFTISLAMDGSNTVVEDEDGELLYVPYGLLWGTDGHAIKNAIAIIDMLNEKRG